MYVGMYAYTWRDIVCVQTERQTKTQGLRSSPYLVFSISYTLKYLTCE